MTNLQKTTFTEQWAAIADKTKEKLQDLPKEYQQHHKVFSEKEAGYLPLHCIKNMEINIKEGSPKQLDCKTYLLNDREMKVLKEELDKDLKKGYIKHRISSYVSPIFFIPKKDGEELRMVIDY